MLKYLKWFARYWKRTKLALSFTVLLTVITIGIKISFPLFLKLVIDEFSTDYNPQHAYQLVFMFLGLAIAREFLWGLLPLVRSFLNNLYTAWMRNDYFKKLTGKANRFFLKHKTGDLITRLTDDFDGNWVRICWYSCSGVFRPFEALLILGFSLGVMFTYSVPLTLYTFLPLPLLAFVMHKLDEKIFKYTNEKQKSISHCNNILESSFSGIKIVKTTLSEKYQYEQYEKAIDDRIDKEKKFLYVNQLVHLFAMMVNHAGTVIVIFVGGIYVSKGDITIGTLIMFIMYLRNLIEPIWTMTFFWASSKQVFQYVERVMKLDETESDLDDENIGIKIEDFNELKLENVSFKYDGIDKSVFNNLNFTLKKGEKLAILGAVGSGKSTILELIAMNLSPTSGDILINNRPISDYSRKSFLNILGYIRQENILFSETLKQNIVLGDSFDDCAINEAVDNSLLKEEIESFHEGLETIVGEKGALLSGGQRQRMAIARTMIRDPKILLMDDCTAAMDAATESKFWDNFNKKYYNSGCIIVTHRLSTAKVADRVILLTKDGLKTVNSENIENIYTDQILAEAMV